MTWSVYKRRDGTKHVIPDEDLKPHRFVDCACRPNRDYDDYRVVIHNSFDRRVPYGKVKKP